MKKRRILSYMAAVAMVFGISIYAFADSTSDYSWLPTFESASNNAIYYTAYPCVESTSQVKYNTNAINFFNNNPDLYPTMEIVNHGGSATIPYYVISDFGDMLLTNHFLKDGSLRTYQVIASPSSIKAATTYYLRARWRSDTLNATYVSNVLSGATSLIHKDNLNSVDNLYATCSIWTHKYSTQPSPNPCSGYTTSQMNKALKAQSDHIEIGTMNTSQSQIIVDPEMSSLNEILSYRNSQESKFENIRFELGSQEVNAVLTFNGGISFDDFASKVSGSDVNFKSYKAIFIDQDGKESTMYTPMLDADIINMASDEYGLTFKGITSAEVSFNADSAAYDNLNNDSDVFFVDMTKPIMQYENQNMNSNDILVSDFAWELQNIQK